MFPPNNRTGTMRVRTFYRHLLGQEVPSSNASTSRSIHADKCRPYFRSYAITGLSCQYCDQDKNEKELFCRYPFERQHKQAYEERSERKLYS